MVKPLSEQVRTTNINVKLTEKERNIVEKLADYLFKIKKIEAPTISDCVRFCIYFTSSMAIKEIEARRYAR